MGKLTRTGKVCLLLAACFLVLTAAVRLGEAPGDGVTVVTERSSDTYPAEQDAGVSSGRININTANAATLALLNGIGEAKAAAIVAYREANGPFASIEEIMDVSGIGQATFDGIKDYICTEDSA